MFTRFRVPFDVVRNEREQVRATRYDTSWSSKLTWLVQRVIYEKFIIDLEKMRHRESAARDYVPVTLRYSTIYYNKYLHIYQAELTKAQLKIVRQELRKLGAFKLWNQL